MDASISLWLKLKWFSHKTESLPKYKCLSYTHIGKPLLRFFVLCWVHESWNNFYSSPFFPLYLCAYMLDRKAPWLMLRLNHYLWYNFYSSPFFPLYLCAYMLDRKAPWLMLRLNHYLWYNFWKIYEKNLYRNKPYIWLVWVNFKKIYLKNYY